MAKITVVYFSGYGHTKNQAEAVLEGVNQAANVTAEIIAIDKEGNLPEGAWEKFEASDAILFGTPTYMGGPAWQFKKFADASSKPWGAQKWKDKIAAGFTNSASINGDKFSTVTYLFTLAMQHGMIWIGTGMMPSNKKDAKREDVNWLAGFSGALAQSPSDASADEAPNKGDLETARQFGKRVAEYTAKTKS